MFGIGPEREMPTADRYEVICRKGNLVESGKILLEDITSDYASDELDTLEEIDLCDIFSKDYKIDKLNVEEYKNCKIIDEDGNYLKRDIIYSKKRKYSKNTEWIKTTPQKLHDSKLNKNLKVDKGDLILFKFEKDYFYQPNPILGIFKDLDDYDNHLNISFPTKLSSLSDLVTKPNGSTTQGQLIKRWTISDYDEEENEKEDNAHVYYPTTSIYLPFVKQIFVGYNEIIKSLNSKGYKHNLTWIKGLEKPYKDLSNPNSIPNRQNMVEKKIYETLIDMIEE